MRIRWERAVAAYVVLGAICLLLSTVLDSIPAAALPFLFALFGPSSWLFWGFAIAPLYLLASTVFALALLGAVFLSSTRSARRASFLLPLLVWLSLGIWAWIWTV